jgi:hypothetical protein
LCEATGRAKCCLIDFFREGDINNSYKLPEKHNAFIWKLVNAKVRKYKTFIWGVAKHRCMILTKRCSPPWDEAFWGKRIHSMASLTSRCNPLGFYLWENVEYWKLSYFKPLQKYASYKLHYDILPTCWGFDIIDL